MSKRTRIQNAILNSKVSTGVAKALLGFYPESNLLLVTGGLVRVDLPEGPLKILRFWLSAIGWRALRARPALREPRTAN
jgi:hypothetical protein